MPRPKVIIKTSAVRKVAAMQATYGEAASFFGVSTKAFKKALARDPRLQRAWDQGQENGKLTLRRKQHRLASTNATMAIHLGKHYLGQTDKTINEITGKDGGPIETVDTSLLSIEEKKALHGLLRKTKPRAKE